MRLEFGKLLCVSVLMNIMEHDERRQGGLGGHLPHHWGVILTPFGALLDNSPRHLSNNSIFYKGTEEAIVNFHFFIDKFRGASSWGPP